MDAVISINIYLKRRLSFFLIVGVHESMLVHLCRVKPLLDVFVFEKLVSLFKGLLDEECGLGLPVREELEPGLQFHDLLPGRGFKGELLLLKLVLPHLFHNLCMVLDLGHIREIQEGPVIEVLESECLIAGITSRKKVS